MRYPLYIISKGRADRCLTARFMAADGVPFHIVVEKKEVAEYGKQYGIENIYVLPFSNLGQGSIPARNWVWEHAKAAGHERHWIFDDNIYHIIRFFRGKRIYCNANKALTACEDFVDRYKNVAIAGLNYCMFGIVCSHYSAPAFYLNHHVYSALLIQNDIPCRWRGRYNEDTDLCLQVLSGGWCTILFNAFMIKKVASMTMKGGNTNELYQGDGRLKMARSLERLWPGVVETKRRFKRPQHVIKNAWGKFDTPLKKRTDLIIEDTPNEYGMTLKQVKPIKSKRLRELVAR